VATVNEAYQTARRIISELQKAGADDRTFHRKSN